MSSEEPAIRENIGRNPDGTFAPGNSGNPSGRPKNTIKDYMRRKFMAMTDEQKEQWLIDNKITGVDQIRLAEGNPHQTSEIEASGSLTIQFSQIFKQDADTPSGAGEGDSFTSEVQDSQSRS